MPIFVPANPTTNSAGKEAGYAGKETATTDSKNQTATAQEYRASRGSGARTNIHVSTSQPDTSKCEGN